MVYSGVEMDGLFGDVLRAGDGERKSCGSGL